MSAEGPLRDGLPAGIELIETLRWEPDAGFVRLERHLARLAGSAAALGFTHLPAETRDRLEAAVGGDAPLRVRLTMNANGDAAVTTQPFAPLPDGIVWMLGIAGIRLRSDDPLLRHKTSARAAYEAARAEIPASKAHEVLLANERGELCEGTFTSLFVKRGNVWLTPPLSCGLLAGVLRAEMLDEGTAQEAVLMPADLEDAEVAIGNSLRGLIRARPG